MCSAFNGIIFNYQLEIPNPTTTDQIPIIYFILMCTSVYAYITDRFIIRRFTLAQIKSLVITYWVTKVFYGIETLMTLNFMLSRQHTNIIKTNFAFYI